MVLVYHYFYLTIVTRTHSAFYYSLVPLRTFWTGVDLFFVLSGFLIGGILLRARKSRNYFQVFYLRRFLRIVPIYFTCLVVAFAIMWAAGNYGSQRFEWMSAHQLPQWPYWIFLQNIWMVKENTLGALAVGVTWSLSVEEQFYLSLPFIVRVFEKSRLLVTCGIVFAPLLRITAQAIWPANVNSYFVLMPCRADALLLGVMAAMAMEDQSAREWIARHRNVFLRMIWILGAVAVALCAKSPGLHDRLISTVGYTWMAVLYTIILVYGINFRESYLGEFLRMRWLRWLGTIAYGTYLFHMLVLGTVFGVIERREPSVASLTDLMLVVMALAVTLGLCWTSWNFFEKRLLGMGHRTEYEFVETEGAQEAG